MRKLIITLVALVVCGAMVSPAMAKHHKHKHHKHHKTKTAQAA